MIKICEFMLKDEESDRLNSRLPPEERIIATIVTALMQRVNGNLNFTID